MQDRKNLEAYLALEYPFQVIADPDGGYVVVFPDLPGCLTQVDRIEEVGPMAEDARLIWIETAYEHGMEIPLPSYPEEYSGKFNLRIPRSLHRQLAESAERDGVSLNQYVETLLARRDVEASLDRRLERLEESLGVTGPPLKRGTSTAHQSVPGAQRRSRASAKDQATDLPKGSPA
jgi:predicted RNase H-like HicB family nuclease